MTRPRLLDLFCGAGGAAVGYHRAGFDVVGVDIKPQPRYPFEFHQGDAMTWPLDGFDAIHASPPCQAFSSTRNLPNARTHPELIAPTRERLQASGVPWVMENVVGAPLLTHLILCGSMFGLAAGPWELWRHRWFETSGAWGLTPHCSHGSGPVMSLAGNFAARESRKTLGVYGDLRVNPRQGSMNGIKAGIAQARKLMGIDWMTGPELVQAIPPAYTEYIGGLLMAELGVVV